MKKLLTIILLLIATSLTAGWKWEQLETNNAPVIEGFWHLAYDPSTEKIILVFRKDDYLSYDTWTFDGVNWEHVCTEAREYCSNEFTDGLVYDENLGSMTDYCLCKFSQWSSGIIAFRQGENYCWVPGFDLEGAGILNIAFDSIRKRTVILGAIPDWLAVIEFDGGNFSYTTLSDWEIPTGYMTFDEARKRTIFLGHRSNVIISDTMEWDGAAWEKVDAPLPDELSQSNMGPLAYFPKAQGTVSVVPIKATLLYKNQKWKMLLGADETPGAGALVYSPPLDGVLGFSVTLGQPVTTYLLTYTRQHLRPFNK